MDTATTLSAQALSDIARAALKEWPLQVVSCELHSQRENTVFRVISDDGHRYALRIHRHGYHDMSALESEHVWTQAMASSGISVPTTVPTKSGSVYTTIAQTGGTASRNVGLVEWVAGKTLTDYLGETPSDDLVQSTYNSLGELVAELHLACAQWQPPQNFKRHAWDADGLVGETPFWGRFWEIQSATTAQRGALLAVRTKLYERFRSLSKSADNYGMIHADLNTDNVLSHNNQLSVIDFDDAGFGWHAFDLAVAVWNQLGALNQVDKFELACQSLVRGYRNKRPQCEHIVAHLDTFVLMRTLMILRWMEDRPETGHIARVPSLTELALNQADALNLT